MEQSALETAKKMRKKKNKKEGERDID